MSGNGRGLENRQRRRVAGPADAGREDAHEIPENVAVHQCGFAEQRTRVGLEQRLPCGGEALRGVPEVLHAIIGSTLLRGL